MPSSPRRWITTPGLTAAASFAPQARQAIAEQGEFDLRFAFEGVGVLAEDVRCLIAGSVGCALFVMGLLELTLHAEEDEPTHVQISPALKLAGGVLAFSTGWIGDINNPVILMLFLLAIMLVQMIYGAWAWFTQELEEVGDLEIS